MTKNEIIQDAVKQILRAMGEDVTREGIESTPTRVARLYENIFYGYDKKLVVMNEKTRNKTLPANVIPITIFKNESKEMLIRKVTFNSFCEHHMVPFFGEAWIGIIPDKKLMGMNKIDKLVKYFGARLQIQERMTTQITDWINENIEPVGVIVVVKARHMCAELQGDEGHFTTSAVRGEFKKNSNSRLEFLKLIK